MPKIMVNRYLNFSCTMPGIFASLPCDMTISSPRKKEQKIEFPPKQYIS